MSKSTGKSKGSPRETAEALIAQFRITKPPVPVELIAKGLGATLQYEPFDGSDDVSAMLFRDDTRVVIGVNAGHPRTRQRFSIAHECGHLQLHEGQMYVDARVNFRNSVSGLAIDSQEIEANAFAAELLMPREFVVSALQTMLDDDNADPVKLVIRKLALSFDVSDQAMEFRLRNLGLIVDE